MSCIKEIYEDMEQLAEDEYEMEFEDLPDYVQVNIKQDVMHKHSFLDVGI